MRIGTDPSVSQGTTDAQGDEHELKRTLTIGIATVLAVLILVVCWGALAKLDGAVIAAGSVVVDGASKRIQHVTGGSVAHIAVRNGDRVGAGDFLITLDETQIRASLAILSSNLVELVGRKARLVAERESADRITFPDDFAELGPQAPRIMQGETKLFEAQRTLMAGQKQQMVERIRHNRDEIRQLGLQLAAKQRETKLLVEELARVQEMYARNLLPVTRVLTLRRDQTRIEGENAAIAGQIARLEGQIAETEIQILAIDQQRLTDAQKELRELEPRITEIAERRAATHDQLGRATLRAPISGIVHELTVHTVGGVVAPGEQIMLIVPNDDALSIEARIAASEIDQVHAGAPARLKFPAFNQATTPVVHGLVTRVAPDASRDAQTGGSYFTIRITVPESELVALGDKAIRPGMPVEAFVTTSTRTALSYVVKPVTDQFERALRER